MNAVFPASGLVYRPWKNGGGKTAEIIVWPKGAGLDDFILRISIAAVESSGPFSEFDGVDRVLTIVEGGEMTLEIGGAQHRLTALAPFGFPGDVPCRAVLAGSPLLDFNVMTRRPLRAKVQVARLPVYDMHFALMLEPWAGLSRFDLVDGDAAPPTLLAALQGALAVIVSLTGPIPRV